MILRIIDSKYCYKKKNWINWLILSWCLLCKSVFTVRASKQASYEPSQIKHYQTRGSSRITRVRSLFPHIFFTRCAGSRALESHRFRLRVLLPLFQYVVYLCQVRANSGSIRIGLHHLWLPQCAVLKHGVTLRCSIRSSPNTPKLHPNFAPKARHSMQQIERGAPATLQNCFLDARCACALKSFSESESAHLPPLAGPRFYSNAVI